MVLRLRTLTDDERTMVERIAQEQIAGPRVAERARIILAANHGQKVPTIAQTLEVSEKMVRMWVKRFTAQGLAGLADAPRPGRPVLAPREDAKAAAQAAQQLAAQQEVLARQGAEWLAEQIVAHSSQDTSARRAAEQRAREAVARAQRATAARQDAEQRAASAEAEVARLRALLAEHISS